MQLAAYLCLVENIVFYHGKLLRFVNIFLTTLLFEWLSFVSKFDDVLLEGSQKRSLKPLSNNAFSTQIMKSSFSRVLKGIKYVELD